MIHVIVLYYFLYGFITKALINKKLEEPLSDNEIATSNYQFVYREGWHARRPKSEQTLKAPVPFVVIHHSYQPKACYDGDDCRNAMKAMQDFHMDVRGWADIGYNFGIGSDGVVYEGRGWHVLGAHALHFNTVSIGICLIGDWRDTTPPLIQLQSAKALIAHGVKKGYINSKYKLVGHRQVRNTECPGEALYKVIQKWSHYVTFPRTYKDLKNVTELPAGGDTMNIGVQDTRPRRSSTVKIQDC